MISELHTGVGAQCTIAKKTKCPVGKISKNITVILPAYNEEVSIGSIILLTRLYSDNVIVVDDASSDRTAEIARKAGAEVIVHKTNMGKGAALETGFKAASDLGADIIVTMNCDGQYNPADIPRVIAPILKGNADIVNGRRYSNSTGRNNPIYSFAGKTILDRAVNLNSGRVTDIHSSFCACVASTKTIIHFDTQGMLIESEMPAGAGKSNLRIKNVEIGTFHDFGTQFRDPIKYILGGLRTVVGDIEVNRPLYIYAVPGFALATCGFYMGLKFLEAFLLGMENLHFWSVYLMVFLSIAGACMTIRGIVMHSLAEVTTQTDGV